MNSDQSIALHPKPLHLFDVDAGLLLTQIISYYFNMI